MAPPSLEEGQKTFQKHLNALLSSKESDPSTLSDTILLGSRASHSIMSSDRVKNVCLSFQSPATQGWFPIIHMGDILLA